MGSIFAALHLTKKIEVEPAGASGWIRGLVFGKFFERNKEKFGQVKSVIKTCGQERLERLESVWSKTNTPLLEYMELLKKRGHFVRIGFASFEAYLEEKVEEAKRESRKLKVLDVGLGTGTQWIEFLERHKEDVEFVGTALAIEPVALEMRGTVVVCDAAHLPFRKEYFDIIVSNYGTHGQELDALENIVFLLKNGGEAMVSGDFESTRQDEMEAVRERKYYSGKYEVLAYQPSTDEECWAYHIRKSASVREQQPF